MPLGQGPLWVVDIVATWEADRDRNLVGESFRETPQSSGSPTPGLKGLAHRVRSHKLVSRGLGGEPVVLGCCAELAEGV